MNLQRRRQLASATDALQTINQLLPTIQETVQKVLDAETSYRDNIPTPLRGSRKATEASRVVDELKKAWAILEPINLLGAMHALAAAEEDKTEAADFGAEREAAPAALKSAAEDALKALTSPSRKTREAAAAALQAALH